MSWHELNLSSAVVPDLIEVVPPLSQLPSIIDEPKHGMALAKPAKPLRYYRAGLPSI